MSLDADQILDRRRLRRKLSFWRVAAFVLTGVALISLLAVSMPGSQIGPRKSHIARVAIDGVIIENRDLQKLLERIEKSNSARALIVSIDSPGGTTAGSEALYEALRKVAAKKPVVAQIGTVAASGGYAAAIAAEHIVARRTSITGSIGVLFQWADVTELLSDIGVEVDTVKSGPLKAEPNPFEPTSEEARASIRALVLDSFEWFVGLVAERRNLDMATARRVSDGRIYTGGQALELGLIDAIGGEDAVRDYLASTHDIDRDLEIREWKSDGSFGGIGLVETAAVIARFAGLDQLAGMLGRLQGVRIGGLDGLVSVWQPQNIEE